MALPIIASLLNFIIFFLGTRNLNRYNPKEIHRRNQFKRAMGEVRPFPSRVAASQGSDEAQMCSLWPYRER